MLARGKASQQCRDRSAGTRVAPCRGNLAQRHEYEGPPMHLRVREQQLAAPSSSSRLAELPATEVQYVDVELSRSPVAAKPPAGPALDTLEGSQQSGRGHRCIDGYNCIEVGGLPAQPDRGGGVQ
jgi:hypothetical protein